MTDIEKLEELITNNDITCQRETIKSGDTLVFTAEEPLDQSQYEGLKRCLKHMVDRFDKIGIHNINPLILEGGLKLDTIISKVNDKI